MVDSYHLFDSEYGWQWLALLVFIAQQGNSGQIWWISCLVDAILPSPSILSVSVLLPWVHGRAINIPCVSGWLKYVEQYYWVFSAVITHHHSHTLLWWTIINNNKISTKKNYVYIVSPYYWYHIYHIGDSGHNHPLAHITYSSYCRMKSNFCLQ